MKGREGKFYIQKRYDINWDRWNWYATCWLGNNWRVWETSAITPLGPFIDYVLMEAKESNAKIS